MRRKRNTAGIPYSSAGRFGAFAVLVATIVMLALVAGYSENSSSNSDTASNAAAASNAGAELVSPGGRAALTPRQVRAAKAAYARRAALRRAQILVQRAAQRRARAARRVVVRRARQRTVVITTVIRPRGASRYRSSFAHQLCAPLGRGGSRAQRRARHFRAAQRRQALRQLNLHC